MTTILFICPHGAAKSVIAAAITNDLGDRRDISLVGVNAGTDPDAENSPTAVRALAEHGLTYFPQPRLVEPADIEGADVLVSLGIDLGDLPATPRRFVDWSDVPDASADVNGLYSILTERIGQLADEVKLPPA